MSDQMTKAEQAELQRKQDARDAAKKLQERQERHVVPLKRFGPVCEYVLGFVGSADTDDRERTVKTLARLLGFHPALVNGTVIKNGTHFMMTPIENGDDAKSAALAINEDTKSAEYKERARARVLADIIGNYEEFAALDTQNNEIAQLMSILNLSKDAATKMWNDKAAATA